MLRTSLSLAALLAIGGSVEASPVAPRAAAPTALANYTSSSTGAKWQYSNCQSDLAYGNRALPFSLDITSKTVESCLEACSKKGYELCGVEYYGECWAGNALDKTSTVQAESACALPCRDNALQLCGGVGGDTKATMNLYKRTNVPVAPAPIVPTALKNYTSPGGTKWGYSNCQSDLAYGNRALGASLSTSNRTVQACLEACSKTEYKLCGVEYYGECWAGNELDKTSTAQAESACSLACADNASQLCGGVGGDTKAAMNLYKRAVVATSPVSPINNSANSTTGLVTSGNNATNATSPLPAPAVPTKYTADPNWTYKGCYTDSLGDNGRALPILLTAANWSPQACLSAAKSKGYSVAGLTYGGECWAGNAVSSKAVKKNDTSCDWTCNDARSFTCGADKLLDVFTAVPDVAQPEMPAYKDWKYDNCYSDRTDNRALGMRFDNPKQTVQGCLDACAAGGAKVCGLEWYGECFGSSTDLASYSTILDDSACATPCNGDSRQFCGGSNALSIFRLNSTTPVIPSANSTAPSTSAPAPVNETAPSVAAATYKGCVRYLGLYYPYSLLNTTGARTSVTSCAAAAQNAFTTFGYAIYNGINCVAVQTPLPGKPTVEFVAESKCNSICAAGTEQTGCGGLGYYSLYEWNTTSSAPASNSTIPPSSNSSIPTNSTVPASNNSTTPVPSTPLPGSDWVYNGCISDQNILQSRLDYGIYPTSEPFWTPDTCRTACATQNVMRGEKVLGCGLNQGGKRCFYIIRGSGPLPVQLSFGILCSSPCLGIPGQSTGCGGNGTYASFYLAPDSGLRVNPMPYSLSGGTRS